MGSNEEDEGDKLVRTIQDCQDLTILSWAAAGLMVRLGDVSAHPPPMGAVEAVTKSLQDICIVGYESRPLAREAASQLLGTLVELVRISEENMEYVRGLIRIAADGSKDWLRAVLRVMVLDEEGPGDPAPAGQGTAFIHACHLLASAVDDDSKLAAILRSEHVHEICSASLLRATVSDYELPTKLVHGGGSFRQRSASSPTLPDLGTEWLPFATAALCLVEVLLTTENLECCKLHDPSIAKQSRTRTQESYTGRNYRFTDLGMHNNFNTETIVDACLAALRRSLVDEGGSMVAQQLHLAGIRTLGQMAHLSVDQAWRITNADGLALGAKMLMIQGADEEATFAALWYLAEVTSNFRITFQRNSVRARLEELGVPNMVERAKRRYPRSFFVEDQGNRLLCVCDRPIR